MIFFLWSIFTIRTNRFSNEHFSFSCQKPSKYYVHRKKGIYTLNWPETSLYKMSNLKQAEITRNKCETLG